MTLAKIPFILAFTVALRLSLTPPNPPPADKDRLKKQAFGSWYTQKYLRFFTAVEISFSALEILLILMTHFNVAVPGAFFNHFRDISQLHSIASAIYPASTTMLASLMMFTGAFIRIKTFHTLGKLFTFEASIQREHRLVTEGPYSFVRHPSYTGLIIGNPSWFLWHFGEGSLFNAIFSGGSFWAKVAMTIWGLSVMGGFLYLTLGRIHGEDRALKKAFGKEWDEYAQRVRYCILPGVY